MVNQAVTDEWERALECLGAAALCREGGFYADSVSRAYYAMMHGAKSALAARGVSANSHSGVMNRFGLNLVQENAIESEWAIQFRESLYDRNRADYDAAAVFTEADAWEACDRAAAFLDRIRALIGIDIGYGEPTGED